MEPDTRIQVNEKGFCRTHHHMLYGMSNRLGHALMLESHTARTRERTSKAFEKMKNAAVAYSATPLAKLSRNGQNAQKSLLASADSISEMAATCLMCETI